MAPEHIAVIVLMCTIPALIVCIEEVFQPNRKLLEDALVMMFPVIWLGLLLYTIYSFLRGAI